METPMIITDTIWQPHVFSMSYNQSPTNNSHSIKNSHSEHHISSLLHNAFHTLPWCHSLHTQPLGLEPKTDISETAQAYHISVALPGVHDSSSISIEWRTARMLIVQGSLSAKTTTSKYAPLGHAHSDIEASHKTESYGALLLKEVSGTENQSQNDKAESLKSGADCESEGKVHVETGTPEDLPQYILRERKWGLFQRSFILPADVVVEGCKAKLQQGLLMIDVPKKDVQEPPEERVMLDDT